MSCIGPLFRTYDLFLEYDSSIVWNPGFTYLVDLFEGAQQNFARRLSSISAQT
jgi:hypothetical protein